jgi:fatty acid desaturase
MHLVPSEAERPQVLPSGHLGLTGKAVAPLRTELRTVSNAANAISVACLWAVTAGLIAVATTWPRWWVVVAVFVFMGAIHVRLAILTHEAAHRLLFSSRRANDLVGTWLLAAPALMPLELYRRSHMAHHRDEFGPDEPDLAFYAGYPCTPAALVRRLARDAVGISGWKNLTPLFGALKSPKGRRVTGGILWVQACFWAISWAATGAWWAYPLLWLLPWMTQWRVLNRLRAIAEHGGMHRSDDRRLATHSVTQHLLARCWLVPYNTGWHLAHHVDMGIPWRHLLRYHRELVDAGYVTDAITFPSYVALWRAAASLRWAPLRRSTSLRRRAAPPR